MVVMATPQNIQIIDELRFSTAMEIVPRFAFRGEIEAAVEKWYGAAEQAEAVVVEAIDPAKQDMGMEFISVELAAAEYRGHAGNAGRTPQEEHTSGSPGGRHDFGGSD